MILGPTQSPYEGNDWTAYADGWFFLKSCLFLFSFWNWKFVGISILIVSGIWNFIGKHFLEDGICILVYLFKWARILFVNGWHRLAWIEWFSWLSVLTLF